MEDYEKLGAFYLGRPMDTPSSAPRPEPFLYDSKDLTTHAVCVGMTGSGKTGLAISLIEEAAIDGIPVIAIDPKGDLGNLLLTFPELRPEDFLPWVDAGDAARKGHTPEEHARWTATLWRKGLADWGQQPERIGRFAAAAEAAIYTPGSLAGRPLTLLKSFDPPSAAVLGDADAMRERVASTTSGLLALLGVVADPIRSREHTLLATLLDRAWREHRGLDLPGLIRQIQTPPVSRVGVMELETFYPASDRFRLAMALNNLMASPGFAAWSTGEPLDVGALLYTPSGKPRLSIVSIAHLSDAERMFFVTALLNEVVAWMRGQPGSSTLRALLYMDEVFGYLPPTANPPSKIPMLTLLKQARAFGLGIVLATQNPVDLDYKALSNAGTWFLGRLQTERDKARVIEGLEGAAAATGHSFDRAELERTLAGLGSRVFLMNNVHEDRPAIFQSRWALSYLAGPLTRAQITGLTERGATAPTTAPAAATAAAPPGATATPSQFGDLRPVLPEEIAERFAPREATTPGVVVYAPSLYAQATLHFRSAASGVDEWRTMAVAAPLGEHDGDPWQDLHVIGEALPELLSEPEPEIAFAPLPSAAAVPSRYVQWRRALQSHLLRNQFVRVLRCRDPKLTSMADEAEGEFRGRLRDALHARRDLEMEKLRTRYAPKLRQSQEQLRKAEERAARERDEYDHHKSQTLISIGATVMGVLFGRKLLGAQSVGRATTAARGAGRANRQRGDVDRAEQGAGVAQEKLDEVERDFQREIEALRSDVDPTTLPVEEVVIRPVKADLSVDQLFLVWEPTRVS